MSLASQGPARRSLDTAWTTQLRVFRALVLRELHSRYGRENLGFIWVFGEPLILASVITLIHLKQPTHYGDDFSPAAFAIIGYTLFIIFRNTFNRADAAILMNQPLLYHRMVTIFDILFSRALMEIIGCIAVTAILLGLAVTTGYAEPPARPLELLFAIFLMAWWTLGLTLIAGCVTYRNELWARQLHVLSYLSIPVSGAWFSLSSIPRSFSDKLQWFPMTLIFEQARYGQFRSSSPAFIDTGYVVAWCAGLTFAGLLLARRLRGKVHG